MAKYFMMTLSPAVVVMAGAVINHKPVYSPAIVIFCLLLVLWTLVEGKGVFEKDISPGETSLITKISRFCWLVSIFISSLDYHSGNEISLHAQATGFVLFSSGIYIRHVSMKELKNHFSYSLKVDEGHALVTTGIYRKLRHPSYSGMIMLSLSIPLIFTSISGFILISLSTIPHILIRIMDEEKILKGGLGEKYVDYMKTTKRLIPYIY